MKLLVVCALVMLTTFAQCGRAPVHPLIGKYDVQGHDFAGKLVFKGAISFTSFAQDTVAGVCKITKVAETFPGAVAKDGLCEGKVSGDKITLDLAPNMSDGGVIFEGQWSDGRIAGNWLIDSFAGARTFGTFEATKRR